MFAFHIVEELIKRLLGGENMTTASREIRLDDLACRSLVVFCTFIPLFAFRDLQRVLGRASASVHSPEGLLKNGSFAVAGTELATSAKQQTPRTMTRNFSEKEERRTARHPYWVHLRTNQVPVQQPE